MKKNIIIILALIVLLLIIVLMTVLLKNNKKVDSSYDFKVYFFKAGKADAILVSKEDKYILIDTGEEPLGKEILKYFKDNKIEKLEALVITHFDKDHVGGAAEVIKNTKINKILQSNVAKDSEYYNNYQEAVSEKKLIPITVLGNFDLSFDDLKITVNGPSKIYEKNESNNSSLIVSIENGDNKFLFMGDAENARIKDYVKENKEQYDFIKIPYHGRYLKRLDNLLDVVKPKYAVMTCSSNEGCENDTIKELRNQNVKYYSTKNKDITVYSNGKNIIIK